MKQSLKDVYTNPSLFIATGFGVGLIPWAPGTWGSLVGVFIYLGIHAQGGSLITELAIIILLFFIALWACHAVSSKYDNHDHPSIVVDEMIAMLLLLLSVPKTAMWIAISFIVFRILDILKPWPVSLIDINFRSGIGVMLDDSVAALMSGLLIYVAQQFLV